MTGAEDSSPLPLPNASVVLSRRQITTAAGAFTALAL
jgi:hypothetical protein